MCLYLIGWYNIEHKENKLRFTVFYLQPRSYIDLGVGSRKYASPDYHVADDLTSNIVLRDCRVRIFQIWGNAWRRFKSADTFGRGRCSRKQHHEH